MILPNQRKAIQDAVDRGADLAAALASALLAALQEAETSWQRISVSLQVERAAVAKLECERDEILLLKADAFRLKGEVEKEIDQRVELRTRDLNKLLQLEKAAKESADHRYQVIDETLERVQKRFGVERENWMAEQSQMSGLIYELKQLVEQQLPESFMKRLRWKRAARRVLKEADRLDPRQF